MRTEDDLRSHYDRLADAASPDRVSAHLHSKLNRSDSPRPRRSLALALGTAVAVAAAAVVVPLTLRAASTSPDETAASPKDTTWQSWLTVPAPPGTSLYLRTLTPDYQLQDFRGDDLQCTILASRNSDFAFESLQKEWGPLDGKSVDINGRPGRLLTMAADLQLLQRAPDKGLHKSKRWPVMRNRQKPTMVHWQPTKGVWAGVTCFRGPFNTEAGMNAGDAEALQLARRIRGENTPLLLPMRPGDAPAGLKIASVEIRPGVAMIPSRYVIELSDGDPGTGVTGKELASGSTHILPPLTPGIDLQLGYLYELPRWYKGEVVTGIPGQATWRKQPKPVLPGAVTIGTQADDYVVQIAGFRQERADTDVKEAAKKLKYADFRKPGSWFDLSDG